MADQSKVLIRLALLGGALVNRETSQVASGMTRMGRDTETAAGRMGVLGRVEGVLGGVGRAARLATLGAAGFAAVIGQRAVTQTTELAHSTLNLARNFGLTASTASSLAAVANVRNIPINQLQLAFTTLSRKVQDAAGGSKTATKVFDQLGLSTRDLRNGQHDFHGLLDLTVAKLTGMRGGTERAALGQQLLGRGYRALLPLMVKGSRGLSEQEALARKYGATIGGKTLTSAEDFIKVQNEMKYAQLGFQIQFATRVLPILMRGINVVLRLVGAFGHLSPVLKDVAIGGVGALVAATGGLAGIAIGIAVAATLIVKHWKDIVPVAERVNKALHGLPVKIFDAWRGAVTAVWGVIRRFGPDVVRWLGKAIPTAINTTVGWLSVALPKAVHATVAVFTTVGRAVVGFVTDLIRQTRLGSGDLKEFGRAVANIFKAVFLVLKVAAGMFIWLFQKVILPVVKRVLPGVRQMFQGTFRVIGGIIKVFSGLFTGDWRKMWQGVKQITGGLLKSIGGLIRAATAPFRQAAVWLGHAVVAGLKLVFITLPVQLVKWLWAAIKGVVGLYGKFLNAGLDLGKAVFRGLKSVFTGGLGALGDIGKAIANAIIDGVNTLIPDKISLPGPLPDIHLPKNPIPHLAAGGMVRAPGWAVVGERGPELAQFPPGTRIIPHHRARASHMLPGASGPLLAHLVVKLDSRVVHEGVTRVERARLEAT